MLSLKIYNLRGTLFSSSLEYFGFILTFGEEMLTVSDWEWLEAIEQCEICL
jgi:hypothetical protein